MTAGLSLEEQLKQLFAYKAEWLNGRLFDLFTEPSYMPALTTPRPCVLIGGRGTGKTTVLRGLSYEGQYALRGSDASRLQEWPYFGIYYRVHSTRVNAFEGPERSADQWERLFGHYFNLVIVRNVVRMVLWLETMTSSTIQVSSEDIELISTALRVPPCREWGTLARALRSELVRFEAGINDVSQSENQHPTIAGAPIDLIFETLASSPELAGKHFFLLIDEYENLKDYQQRILNTLLKHAQPPYTFKIGVRELGWRDRSVAGGTEKLISPADYERVDIATVFRDEVFRDFALKVANERLSRLEGEAHAPQDVRVLLPQITLEEEALEFGVGERADATIARLEEAFSEAQVAPARAMPPLQVYLFEYWAQAQNSTVDAMYRDYLANPRRWETRYVNYKYALVFSLHRKGRRINKFYAGWDTFVQLSAGNIRYCLELLEESLLAHVRAEHTLGPIAPRRQTIAAQEVGRSNLEELEGLDEQGARLTRLVLSLGRIFQVMARQPSGHTPEVNQFYLVNDGLTATGELTEGDDVDPQLRRLLTAAVTHLALLRSPGTKLLDEASIRQHDYMLHPIFAAFFQFSHRRKRKMQITPQELALLVTKPKAAIPVVLARSRRRDDEEIPDQLLLFESFYDNAS